MPVKKRIQLRNVQNVGDSKTVLIDCPVGNANNPLRYHWIGIQIAYASGTNTVAGAMAHFSEVRLKVNGRVQRIGSGAQWRDKNILNGTAFDCTGAPNTSEGVTLPIFFAEPWLTDEKSQDSLAWQTAGFESFQIEIDTSASIASSSATAIKAWAVVDNSPAASFYSKWVRMTVAAAGTSFDVSTMDRRDYLRVVSIYADSGGSNAPTQVTFRVNGDIKHELVATANTALLTEYNMTPAASGRTSGVYDMVLDHDGLLDSAWNLTGAEPTLTIAAGGAMSGNTVIIVERVGPLE
jgi:hypothetical protein